MLRRTRPVRGGFTLIEVLVSMVLVSILLSGLYLVMLSSTRYLAEGQTYSSTEQEVVLSLARLEQEMANAANDQLTAGHQYNNGANNFPYVCFMSPDAVSSQASHAYQFDANGLLEMTKWVCYYMDPTTGYLERAEIPFTAGPTSVTSSPVPTASVGSYNWPSTSGNADDIRAFMKSPTLHPVARELQVSPLGFAVTPSATYPNLYTVSVTVLEKAVMAASSDADKVTSRNLQTAITVFN